MKAESWIAVAIATVAVGIAVYFTFAKRDRPSAGPEDRVPERERFTGPEPIPGELYTANLPGVFSLETRIPTA